MNHKQGNNTCRIGSSELLKIIIPWQRLWFWFFSCIVFVALAIFYVNLGDDYDIWWHLRYGKDFIGRHTWHADHTLYSWTPINAEWCYVTWIGSITLYLLYQIGGFIALNVFQWLIFLAVAWLALTIEHDGEGKTDLLRLAALLCVGIAINPVAVYVKPELFTILFFASTVFIYMESKRAGHNYWFYAYPLLFMVWVNTHGGFINGLLFVAVIWLLESVAILLGLTAALSRRQWKHMTTAIALSAVAVCVNPYGIWYLPAIATSLLEGLGSSHVQIVTAYTPVWRYLFSEYPFFRLVDSAWMLVIMSGLAVVGLIFRWRNKRSFDPVLILMLIMLLVCAFLMARAVIYFALFWLFAVPQMFRTDSALFRRMIQITSVAFITSLTGFILYQMAVANPYDSWFGSRIENWVPINESAIIRKHNLPMPLFNDYLTGGYLIWALYPDYKVFIDPRYGPYETSGVWDDYLSLINARDLQRAWSRLNAKYKFNTAIMHIAKNPALTDLLLTSSEWRLVYFNRVAAVFVRTKLAQEIHNACQGDMLPEKYIAVTNPDMLFRVFLLYCNYHPSSAKRIYEIYLKNVRACYQRRSYHLQRMEMIIKNQIRNMS